MNMRAATHAHIPRRWLGTVRMPSSLRGLGQSAEDYSLAQSELLQNGFSDQQIAALQAAGADSDTMMGIATSDSPTEIYNSVMSSLTGVPVNQLSSAGIGASAANFWNVSSIINGVPNWMLIAGAGLFAAAIFAAERRYR